MWQCHVRVCHYVPVPLASAILSCLIKGGNSLLLVVQTEEPQHVPIWHYQFRGCINLLTCPWKHTLCQQVCAKMQNKHYLKCMQAHTLARFVSRTTKGWIALNVHLKTSNKTCVNSKAEKITSSWSSTGALHTDTNPQGGPLRANLESFWSLEATRGSGATSH